MIQSKKCKGHGKAKSVKGCGKMVQVEYRKYGLCQSCYADFILNTDYGRILLEKATLKATKPRRELESARKKERENKSLGWLLTNTKTACHDFVKERDKGKDCVSCGSPWHNDHQAGHFKKAELFSSLRFNENNIHNQCPGCNIHKDGNVQQYETRIHLRIGRDGLKELNRLAELEKKIDFKWDRQELKEIRKYYQQKIKELKP